MNTPPAITIIGTAGETIHDAKTPVGRILAAMCDGCDTIENRQGLTRITFTADTGDRKPASGSDEPPQTAATAMQPAAGDPPWTREQTLTNIRVRAEHRITNQTPQPADISAGDDIRQTMTQHRSVPERERRSQ